MKTGKFITSKYGWEFTVQPREGRNSSFPIDMLRYDSAYPVNSDAVSAIAQSLGGTTKWFSNDPNRTKVVKLRTSKGSITPDRWKSFGWVIKEAFELTKDGTPKTLNPSFATFTVKHS